MTEDPVTETPMTGFDRSTDVGFPGFFYRFLRNVVYGINRVYWRVKVEGIEKFPTTGAVIVAPVHRSYLDFLVVSEVSRRKLLYMAKDGLWRFSWLGRLVENVGGFPVNREGADRLALDRAQSVLERGEVLVLFPEGGRRYGSVIEDLHEGAAFLSARTGAPIVPVGIGGSEAAMPKGSRWIRPVKVTVIVGDPLEAPQRSARGRVPRHQVHELTERLRTELQGLFDQAEGRQTESE